jgi:competence protein ComEA
MTVFTSLEKKVIMFLSCFCVLGTVVGLVRNGDFFSNTSDFKKDENKFKSLADSVFTKVENISSDILIADTHSIININLASKNELVSLPKIGPVTAERIIRYREDYGKFSTVNDLINVKGIGDKTMAKIASLITVETQYINSDE